MHHFLLQFLFIRNHALLADPMVDQEPGKELFFRIQFMHFFKEVLRQPEHAKTDRMQPV